MTWLSGDAVLCAIMLWVDAGEMPIAGGVKLPIPLLLKLPVEVCDKVDVANTKAASKISSPAGNCGIADGSWSSAAPEAKNGGTVVEDIRVLSSNTTRALEFNNSGNVEAVDSRLELETTIERVELMAFCCATVNLEAQP